MQHEDHHRHTVRKKRNANPKQPLTGITVLLVEDELDMAELLLFILREAGAEVTWVTQASEALLQLNRSCPDILISNIKLPDRNGDWLIRQIRQKEAGTSQHLPAIAITSYTREVVASRMQEAGFEEFLPKYFEPNQMISIILKLTDAELQEGQ